MSRYRKLKGELVSVGFPADEARLAAVTKFLLEEEVFSLEDLEGASVASLGKLARGACIQEEDVRLLETVVSCRGRCVKRRALDKKPLMVTTVSKATGARELLEMPVSSDLDIASKGPRAAGNLLAAMLAKGTERLSVYL